MTDTTIPTSVLTGGEFTHWFGVDVAEFAASAERRTVAGMLLPFNQVGVSRGRRYMFLPGSVELPADPRRLKLLDTHDKRAAVGVATRVEATARGVEWSAKVARGAEGDRILQLAEDGVYDGFSGSVEFTNPAGIYPHPDDPTVTVVAPVAGRPSARLTEGSITAMPAMDGALVSSVNLSRNGDTMDAPTAPAPADTPTPTAPAAAPAGDGAAAAQFTRDDLVDAVRATVEAAFASLGIGSPEFPHHSGPRPVAAGRPRVEVTREPPVYRLDGTGPSFVKDAWRLKQGTADDDAVARLRKYQEQTADFARQAADAQFATITTGTASAVIPPGYRPDLYVGQLPQGRPLIDGISKGTLADATPFTIPRFVSAAGATADHVQGTNPADGTLSVEPVTVTPGGISGRFRLTREIADSSNPAIDAIALAAMRESYSQQTEAKVYTELNGANGVGGTITSGFVPSGAQVFTSATAAGQGFDDPALIEKLREALILYPFRRFATPTRAHCSQEGAQALGRPVDTTGRPMLPPIGATNAPGVAQALGMGWNVDGLPAVPTWSMTGNAATDADVIGYNSNDVWCWESALLMFRFEEVAGPANIDLCLFAYFATRVLRPRGLFGIRHTLTP